ncbi:hypothetical protein CYMTET_16530 [Cymbomonas tetramitiformis]|uniref:Uncharacterized protein n=1 Tax=Cymbomonas tetramitiformis TaxID=36881 RepID=A0AAE0GC02_9CHLO|nr:hypothetical protein CYMTET_16530 [Cymbomonas tetramitiformis]
MFAVIGFAITKHHILVALFPLALAGNDKQGLCPKAYAPWVCPEAYAPWVCPEAYAPWVCPEAYAPWVCPEAYAPWVCPEAYAPWVCPEAYAPWVCPEAYAPWVCPEAYAPWVCPEAYAPWVCPEAYAPWVCPEAYAPWVCPEAYAPWVCPEAYAPWVCPEAYAPWVCPEAYAPWVCPEAYAPWLPWVTAGHSPDQTPGLHYTYPGTGVGGVGPDGKSVTDELEIYSESDRRPVDYQNMRSTEYLPASATCPRLELPVPLLLDNDACRSIAENIPLSQKIKHVLVRFHMLRDFVRLGWIICWRVPSEKNLADPYTKPVPPTKNTVPYFNMLFDSYMDMQKAVIQAARSFGFSTWRLTQKAAA